MVAVVKGRSVVSRKKAISAAAFGRKTRSFLARKARLGHKKAKVPTKGKALKPKTTRSPRFGESLQAGKYSRE
jgi:hypothetical protein